MPMLWKSLNCWSCKSEKSKRAKKLMPLVYPSQTFLQTWKVVSYWQQQYHPGYIPKQWKSSYVSNRDSYNNSQEQVGKFFLKVYHSSLEGVLIIQQSDGSGRYSHNMTSCVNVIICIDSFWSLCAESVNGGTDVVIKGQWTMTTGILIGGISGVRPSKQIKAVIGIRETWSSSGKDRMRLSFFFSHQKMYNGGFFFNKNWLFL